MNCLVTQNGKIIDCGGATHKQICKTHFKMGLDKYLKNERAIRVKIHDEQAAVESYDVLSGVQRSRMNSILCKNNAYVLVTFIRGVLNVKTSFMHPIRNL